MTHSPICLISCPAQAVSLSVQKSYGNVCPLATIPELLSETLPYPILQAVMTSLLAAKLYSMWEKETSGGFSLQ